MNTAPISVMMSSVLLPLIGAMFYLVICTGDSAPIACAAIKLSLVLVPIAVTWRWGRVTIDAGQVRRWAQIAFEGAASGVLMASGLLWLLLGPGLGAVHASVPRVMVVAQEFGMVEFHHFLGVALLISLLHSGFEEYYWRWFIFGQLSRRLPLWGAHVVAGCGFGAFHLVIASVYAGLQVGIVCSIVVGLAGMAWSVLYRRHGSVLGVWISHALCDAALFYVEWLMISGRV